MPNIISIHSFKQGTGKSHIAANMATMLANDGWRVGLIDANFETPSIATIFSLPQEEHTQYLNDVIAGRCGLNDVIHDMSSLLSASNGKLIVVPASDRVMDSVQAVREGIPDDKLKEAVSTLSVEIPLDIIVMDTGAGLTETTMTVMGLSTALAFVMQLDHQEYQGTAATIELARKLEIGRIALLVNDVSPSFSAEQVKQEVEHSYQCPAYILPHSDEMLVMTGRGLIVLQQPKHPYTEGLRQAVTTLVK
jgi:MinD-like ATPase involved in chromosome partitioning or flagellar assembly